jgi:hypothetical protein
MKWNFKELTQGDDFQGIRDGDIELFDKTRYQSVVREAIQNSLDARLNELEPVKIEFNYFKVNKSNFPNIAEIENHLLGCEKWEKANDDDKELISTMYEAIEKDSYTCLEIADYNTKGMELKTSFDSFAHSRNVSTKSSAGSAGSKGMGKAAYFAASYLHTIFVTSIFHENKSILFQGISRISTHYKNGTLLNYKGYFSDDFNPITDSELIPSIFTRNQPGTSAFILGVWDEIDKQLLMEKELVNNFWLAILEGGLIVTIDKKEFNKENIYNEILRLYPTVYESGQYNINPNPRPYIETYLGINCTNKTYQENITILGKVKFIIAKNEEYQGRIANFRYSKMLIFKDPSKLYRGYCGIFVCEDENGNEILKKLENATHTEWRRGNWKDPIGKEALDKLKEFQFSCIKDFVGDQNGDEITIPEFDKLLSLPGLKSNKGSLENNIDKNKEKIKTPKTIKPQGDFTPKSFHWLRSRAVRDKGTFKYIITMNSKKAKNKIDFEVFVGSDDKTGREIINISSTSQGEFDRNKLFLNLNSGENEVEIILEDTLKHAIRLKEIKEVIDEN